MKGIRKFLFALLHSPNIDTMRNSPMTHFQILFSELYFFRFYMCVCLVWSEIDRVSVRQQWAKISINMMQSSEKLKHKKLLSPYVLLVTKKSQLFCFLCDYYFFRQIFALSSAACVHKYLQYVTRMLLKMLMLYVCLNMK